MTWSYDEIVREWLDGASLQIEPTDVVRAFEVVERTIGNDWIQSSCVQPGAIVKGVGPTLSVVFMGQRLSAVEDCVGASELFDRIKVGDRAAISELTGISLAKILGSEVEVGPHVQVGDRIRRPDFRIRMPNQAWAYVEVAAPDTSALAEQAQAVLQRIGKLLPTLAQGTSVEVFLRGEPADAEIEVIVAATENALRELKPRIEEISDLALLAINQDRPGQVVVRDYGEEPRPRYGFARAEIVDGQATKHISVRIPFTDERAEAFLSRESRQLPTTEPGLIMIDMRAIPSGLKSWEPLILRRFQPQLHTRVSAVCLFYSGLMPTSGGLEFVTETVNIVNEHARLPLHEWLLARLDSFVGNMKTKAG